MVLRLSPTARKDKENIKQNQHYPVKRNHGFRKWADTTMIRSAINVVDKETLLGHSTGLDDKYYRPTGEEVLDEYQKAVDLLTINEENRLKIKVATLEERESEVQTLKAQMSLLQENFDKLRHYINKEEDRKKTLLHYINKESKRINDTYGPIDKTL